MASPIHSSIIEVDGFRVEVQRRQVKHVRLAVRPDGSIRLSAPPSVPERELRYFLRERRAWLAEHTEKSRTQQAPRDDLHTGGRVLLWGSWREVTRVVGARPSAELRGRRVHIVAADDEAAARAVARLRRREIEARVAELAPDLEERVGRRPSGYAFRLMTSRYGTCNPRTGKITLNTWLVQRDVEQLRFVLAHELAHLVETGHGPRFKATMDRVLPGWPDANRALRATPLPRG